GPRRCRRVEASVLPLPPSPRRARWTQALRVRALRVVDRLQELRPRASLAGLRRAAGALVASRRSLAGALLFVGFAILLIRCTSPLAPSSLGPAPDVQVLLDRD